MSEKYKIAVSYVGFFNRLLVISKKILPNNNVVAEITNKFNIAKNDEISFMEYSGPHIWRYREYIARNDRTEILRLDFRGELNKCLTDGDSDSQLARDFLELLISKASTLADAEWDVIHKLVLSVLAEYGKYLQRCIMEANTSN